eukprot:924486-Rhodomonas_salina.1
MKALDKYITNRPWVPPIAFSAVVVCAAAGSIWFLSNATGEVSKHRVNEISGSVRYAGAQIGYAGAQIGGGLTLIAGSLTLFAAAYFLKPQSGK